MEKELNKLVQQYIYDEPSEDLKQEVKFLISNQDYYAKELHERFAKNLEFGTAGIRGLMQAGYNRMNEVSVFLFACAVFDYFSSIKKDHLKIVVGFDARKNSELFAHELASVLSTNKNYHVHIFDKLIPTPLCAFATKYLDADIGFMITASHNPKEDNGIKVFNKKAMQMDKDILNTIAKFFDNNISRTDFWKNHEKNQLFYIEKNIYKAYFDYIFSTQLLPEEPKDKNIKFVYTPLHGVAKYYFSKVLQKENYHEVINVSIQEEPNGLFPTVNFPNPEEEHTLDEAYDLAIKHNINLVLANDPDADRLQVAFKEDNAFYKLTGNEMGSILGYFAIKKALKDGFIPVVATSIVSSRMLKHMSLKMKAVYTEALTGFGNIAKAASIACKSDKYKIAFAYEEAIGFIVGDEILDKDGILSGVRFVEILAYLSYKNLNINDFLLQLNQEFGIFESLQWHERFEGLDAQTNMSSLMSKIRNINTNKFSDIFDGQNLNKSDLSITQSLYPNINANVIILENDNIRFIIRPSGTEPKIKFYLESINKNTINNIFDTKKNMQQKNIIYKKQLTDLIFN